MSDIISLTCKKCNVEKAPSEFYEDSTYASGYRTAQCKACKRSMRNAATANRKKARNEAAKKTKTANMADGIIKRMHEFHIDEYGPEDLDNLQNFCRTILYEAEFVRNSIRKDTITICVVMNDDINDGNEFELNVEIKNVISNHFINSPQLPNIFASDITHKIIVPNRMVFTYTNDDYDFYEEIDNIKEIIRGMDCNIIDNVI